MGCGMLKCYANLLVDGLLAKFHNGCMYGPKGRGHLCIGELHL